jgi:hypothetical protein
MCLRALQAELLGVKRGEDRIVTKGLAAAILGDRQQDSHPRRVVVRAVINGAVADSDMIVMRRDHHLVAARVAAAANADDVGGIGVFGLKLPLRIDQALNRLVRERKRHQEAWPAEALWRRPPGAVWRRRACKWLQADRFEALRNPRARLKAARRSRASSVQLVRRKVSHGLHQAPAVKAAGLG